ncbi:MAG: restriction endonuclease [Chloroflexi bacterium]|nr:restriction endonuclease [Chloroflexota bacterium]MBU1752231.1 restriction endonuclease [Chloroflexota bacterium]MBU1879379.1 restriction endonuclease [Chloroflexota bacterium]
MAEISVPTFDTFMNPTIQALKDLGGSGTIEEINSRVIELTGLTDAQIEVPHDPDKGGQTEVEYRLAWTRTYLKKYDVLENSSRGVWALTPKGRQLDRVNPKTVRQFVQQQMKEARAVAEQGALDEVEAEATWRDKLLDTLLNMEPAAFERLIQRMLRESGFIQVEVTGRSGDGGIDGKGIMRLGGLLSFHVLFQCKRYRGAVTASQVRDFRGAMVGRADKGLLVTTGNFTKDAVGEATRDGATAIDLIDGDQLLDKLKELALGVQTRTIEVEQVTVNREWFAGI